MPETTTVPDLTKEIADARVAFNAAKERGHGSPAFVVGYIGSCLERLLEDHPDDPAARRAVAMFEAYMVDSEVSR